MCGIVGFLNVNNEEMLRRMANRIRHRGPDAHGFVQFPNAGLAHQRLSIIDLSESGNQPMYDDENRYVIIYNGEVYNFEKLKESLVSRGYRFRSTGDTEVILKYFIEFGAHGLSDLDGMFAFAIYDSKEHRLWIARDRFGIKPLYYIQSGNRLYFSSEIKAFYEIPDLKLTIDEEALFAYFRFQYIPSPHTIYREVKKLQPGHFLTAINNEIRIEKYWDLETENLQDTDNTAPVDKTRKLLEASIKMHLIADVPVGVFLSGGLDSSVLAAIASKMVPNINTFSIVFDNSPREDERVFSRQVAKYLRTHHHEFAIKPEMGEEMIADVVYHLDEPMGDPAVLPTYLLSKETSKHIKVVLNGEGADELFGGYKQYFLDDFVANGLFKVCIKAIQATGIHRKSYNLQRLFRAAGAPSMYERRQEYASVFSNEDARKFLRGTDTPNDFYLNVPRNNETGLNKWLRDDMRYWLPDDILMKADKMMMRFALEGRVPFLENDLFSYVNQLPAGLKVHGFQGKRLLRKVAEGYLPKNIVYRKKHGFNVPLRNWFRGPLITFLTHSMESLKIIPWLDTEYTAQLVKSHVDGKQDNTRQLYLLLNLALWLKQNESKLTFGGRL